MFKDAPKSSQPMLAAFDKQHDKEQRHLKEQVGMFGQMTVDRNQKKRMVEVADRLNEDRARAIYSAGRTAIELTGQRICSTLVASSLLEIGAQTHVVNAQAAIVDRRLTQSAFVESAAHVQARSGNHQLMQSRYEAGEITADERAELFGICDRILQQDITRTLGRMQKSKDAVQALCERATDFISSAKPHPND